MKKACPRRREAAEAAVGGPSVEKAKSTTLGGSSVLHTHHSSSNMVSRHAQHAELVLRACGDVVQILSHSLG